MPEIAKFDELIRSEQPTHPLVAKTYVVNEFGASRQYSFAQMLERFVNRTIAGRYLTDVEKQQATEILHSVQDMLDGIENIPATTNRDYLTRAKEIISGLLTAKDAGIKTETSTFVSDDESAARYFLKEASIPLRGEAGIPNETERQFFDRIIDGLHVVMTQTIYGAKYLRTVTAESSLMRMEDHQLFYGPRAKGDILQAKYAAAKGEGVQVYSIESFLFKIKTLFRFDGDLNSGEFNRRIMDLKDRLASHADMHNGAAEFRIHRSSSDYKGFLTAVKNAEDNPVKLEPILALTHKVDGTPIERTELEKKIQKGESLMLQIYGMMSLSTYELETEGLEAKMPGFFEFLQERLRITSLEMRSLDVHKRMKANEAFTSLREKLARYARDPDFKPLSPGEINVYKYLKWRDRLPEYKSGTIEKNEIVSEMRSDLTQVGLSSAENQDEVLSFGVSFMIRSGMELSFDEIEGTKEGVPVYTVVAELDTAPKLFNLHTYLGSRDKDEENNHPNKALMGIGHGATIWARRMHYTYVENGVRKRDSIARILAMGKSHLIDWKTQSQGSVDESVRQMWEKAVEHLKPKMFCTVETLPFKLDNRVRDPSILNTANERKLIARLKNPRETTASLEAKLLYNIGKMQMLFGPFSLEKYMIDGYETHSKPEYVEEIVKKYFDTFIINFIKYWLNPLKKGAVDKDGVWDFISTLRSIFSVQHGPVNDVIKDILFNPELKYDTIPENATNAKEYADAIYRQIYDYLLYNLTFEMMWFQYLPAYHESPSYQEIPFVNARTENDWRRQAAKKGLTVEEAKEKRKKAVKRIFNSMTSKDWEEYAGTTQAGRPLLSSVDFEALASKTKEIRDSLAERKSVLEADLDMPKEVPKSVREGEPALRGISKTHTGDHAVWTKNPAFDGIARRKHLIFSREALLPYFQQRGMMEGRKWTLVGPMFGPKDQFRIDENIRIGSVQDIIDLAALLKVIGVNATD